MKITRELLRSLAEEIDIVLDDIQSRYEGLTLVRGTTRYNNLEATLKIKVQVVNEAGESERERRDFDVLSRSYGLLPEDLGTVFTSRGTDYRLTGINPRARKYPIKGERVSDNRKFKFPKSVTRHIRIVHHTP